jgi:hypothetical protein
MRTRHISRILADLDPARHADIPPPLHRPEQQLATILAAAEPGAPARHPVYRRRPALTVAVVAIVGIVVAVASLTTQRTPYRGPAVTPAALRVVPDADPRPAAQVLRQLAAVAGVSDVPRRGAGDTEHLVITSWSLYTQIDGERVTSAVIPQHRESWRNGDDSGRIVERYEEPVFSSEDQRQAWQAAGSPGNSVPHRESTYQPGSFPAMYRGLPPTDPTLFAEWLGQDHPAENGPHERIVAITDLLRERIPSPAVRSLILRELAQLPGITFDGHATDRVGRQGLSFSVLSTRGLETRYSLIVSPTDGTLLGYEKTLTRDAGKLDVTVPAVIGYESYLAADYV